MITLLLAIALAVPSAAPGAEVAGVAAGRMAAAPAAEVAEVRTAALCTTKWIGTLPVPRTSSACSLALLYDCEAQFLSGPWSAVRRLRSARKRGDADAARRLEATLDALLAEALAK